MATTEQLLRSDQESPKLIVCATFLGEFLASADDSLMISTYTSISSEFRGLSIGSWLLVAYNFGYCVASPVYGVLGGLFGRKKTLLCSYGLFALGCIACGVSTSMIQLILARVLVGLSGAGMVSLVSVVLTELMPPKDVVMYRSYGNMVNIAGRSLGAPLGGFLLQTVGWRWSFLGQVPLALVSILIAARQMPSFLNQTQHYSDSPLSKLRRIDLAGIASFAATILLFLFAVENFRIGTLRQSQLFCILGVAFLISIAVFLLIENSWATEPLIPLSLMKKSLGAFCLSQFLVVMSRSAFIPTIVAYFVRVHKASDFQASLVNTITMLGAPIGSYAAGIIIKRTQRYKVMGIVATCIMALNYFVIFLRWRTGSLPLETLYLLPLGFTIGVFLSVQFVGMTASVLKKQLGQCLGTFYLCQQMGRILGPVFGLKLIDHIFQDRLWKSIAPGPEKQLLIHGIINDTRFAFTLPESVQAIVRGSYLYGFQIVPVLCQLCVLLALPAVVIIKEANISD